MLLNTYARLANPNSPRDFQYTSSLHSAGFYMPIQMAEAGLEQSRSIPENLAVSQSRAALARAGTRDSGDRAGPPDAPIHVREAIARLTKARQHLLADAPDWLSGVYQGESLIARYEEDLRLVAYWFIDGFAVAGEGDNA